MTEEKICGFSDISCILQHMLSRAKEEELAGNLEIAGDLMCWAEAIEEIMAAQP